MKRTEPEYFVYISSEGISRPVRVRDDKHSQLERLLDGEPCIAVPDGEGRYILVVDSDSSSVVNVPASILLGGRARHVRGSAVFCMISTDGDYVGFEKKAAQGMCAVLNLLGR